MRKYYTIDDLYDFCKTNDFSKFSAKEHNGNPLIIHSFEDIEVNSNATDGLLPIHLKACHIGKNANGSCISEDDMKRCMASFKGRPILAAIYKTDTGEYEFRSHDVKIVDDGIEYIEQPVGVVSEVIDPYLEYDKDADKTYLMTDGNIFEDYSHAADILLRHNTCKCSVEIAVYEMTWDAKEDCLMIEDFSFRGVTILGYEQDGVTEISEGMKGSKISIDNFSIEQNSVFTKSYEAKLLETLDALNNTLSNFSINNSSEKGVECVTMSHFEELLQQYNVTKEDIDFEFEGMSDEELDQKFEEKFSIQDTEPVENAVDNVVKSYSENENGDITIQYSLSHDDIRCGLYRLLDAERTDDDPWYYIDEVYDDYFIYSYYREYDNVHLKRKYDIENDIISLGEDKVEVTAEWLTAAEKAALDALKSDYAELKSYKENMDAEILKAEKDAIFAKAEYSALADNDAFKELMANAEKFSVDEIDAKCKVILADYVIAGGTFSNHSESKSAPKSIGVVFNKPVKKKAYGNIFD